MKIDKRIKRNLSLLDQKKDLFLDFDFVNEEGALSTTKLTVWKNDDKTYGMMIEQYLSKNALAEDLYDRDERIVVKDIEELHFLLMEQFNVGLGKFHR